MPFRTERKPDDTLIILQNQDAPYGRFFTTLSDEPGDDQTRLNDGTVAYTVLGYAATTAEAQMALYGRVFD